MQPPLIEYPENDEVSFDVHGYPQSMIKSTPTTPNGHHSAIHPHHHHQYAYTPSSTSYNSNSLLIPSNDSIYGGSQSVKTPSNTAFSFGAVYASAASNAPFHSHSLHHQPVTQPTTPILSGNAHHHSFAPRTPYKHTHSHHNVLYEEPQAQQHQQMTFPDIDFGSAPLLCEDIVDEVFNELQLTQQ